MSGVAISNSPAHAGTKFRTHIRGATRTRSYANTNQREVLPLVSGHFAPAPHTFDKDLPRTQCQLRPKGGESLFRPQRHLWVAKRSAQRCLSAEKPLLVLHLAVLTLPNYDVARGLSAMPEEQTQQ